MAEDNQPTKARPAKRREKKEPVDWAKKTVGLDTSTHTSLVKSAEKLNMSKAKYASAAIGYFVQNGLDPTKAGVSELAQLRTLIGESAYEVRKQNADIGNRLVAIIRTWEANQYKFMQTQHIGVVGYLEDIEANILNHQVAVESQLLAPMLERLVRSGVETHLSRILSEMLLLKFKDDKYPFTDGELQLSTQEYNEELDKKFVTELRRLLTTATVTAPTATKKPPVVVPTLGPPPKPAGSNTPPSAAPASPKS
jgi:hypothetical protein